MREGCLDGTHLSRSQWRVDLGFYFWDWGHEGQTIFTLSGFNFFPWFWVIFSPAPLHLTTGQLKILPHPLLPWKNRRHAEAKHNRNSDCWSFTSNVHCHFEQLTPASVLFISAAIELLRLVRCGSRFKLLLDDLFKRRTLQQNTEATVALSPVTARKSKHRALAHEWGLLWLHTYNKHILLQCFVFFTAAICSFLFFLFYLAAHRTTQAQFWGTVRQLTPLISRSDACVRLNKNPCFTGFRKKNVMEN